MLDAELRLLESMASGISGYHLMQLSYTSAQQAFYSFGHSHCFNLGTSKDNPGNAVTEYEALPLPSETIDTGLLHHVLEYSENPHLILNEVSRVIAPGGHLVLIVFNPVSLLGVLKWPMKLLSDSSIWHYRGLRSGRILDWLQLLHFQPLGMRTSNLLFPMMYKRAEPAADNKLMCKLGEARILLGAVSVVVARKTVLKTISGNGFPQRAKHAVGLNLKRPHSPAIEGTELNKQ